jgi:ribosomal protein L37E
MAENADLGSCRHCGQGPVHVSARWCPHCGGIAPFVRTPAPRNKNALVAILGVAFILLLTLVALFFGGR